MNAIAFQGVSKSYSIYESPGDRLKELLAFNRLRRHKDFWALHYLAMLLRENDAKAADDYLEQALTLYPNEPLLLGLRGHWRGLDGNLAGASADLQVATKGLPLRDDFWLDYAVCLEKAGRKAEAVAAENRGRAARNW